MFVDPDLSHGHAVLPPAGHRGYVVSNDAGQNGGGTEDGDRGVFEGLRVPIVLAADVGTNVGIAVEPVAFVGHPAKLGMQQTNQRFCVTSLKGGGSF